jgi:hypothetical protein
MSKTILKKRHRAVARWIRLLRQRFPNLTKPQAVGLALWSIGIVLAKAASLHAVTLALAVWLDLPEITLRKRLQEWYMEAAAKKGHGSGGKGLHRRDWDPHAVFPFLLRWIIEDWPNQQLVFALDPTNFGDRFTVLAISVLYRSCAVPVAWTVLPGGEPGAWEPHWERMLRELATLVPAGWQVLVTTDRGMYSPRLFRCLQDLHWHPFLRIRQQGFCRRDGSLNWLSLNDLQFPKGQTQAWRCQVFKNEEGRLDCTLVAYQDDAHAEPWLIVTDLSPELAQATWYGLRGWIEQGFKRLKGEGWKFPRTRMTDCTRLERLWLAVAVATLWVLEVGGEAEVQGQSTHKRKAGEKKEGEATPALPDLEQAEKAVGAPPGQDKPSATKQGESTRLWAVFARGWQVLRNALAVGVILLGSWHPEPWPDHPPLGLPPTPVVAARTDAVKPHAAQPPLALQAQVVHEHDSG